MSYTDSLIIVYCCLSALLHFLGSQLLQPLRPMPRGGQDGDRHDGENRQSS